jgi:hypothetical protein
VPPIRHLDRFRRTLAHTVCVGAGAVARDHRDAGMLAQPHGEGLGLTIRQQVNDPISLQVDQDGAVAVPTAPRPIIDRQHARCWSSIGALIGIADHPQQRVGAGRHGQPLGQTRSSFAAECEAEMTLQTAQPPGSAC